jgi:radical SAM protein with 4Fe4S-binding SPASM domain
MTRQPAISADVLLQQLAMAGLLPPSSLTVAITTACSLRCGHCLVNGRRSDQEPLQISVPALRTLLHDFADLGGKQLCITGGEPLTHPAWHDIVTASCADPRIDRITLQTNGTLLDRHTLAKLSGERFRKLDFQVSLDGCSPATHELVRGAGSFARAMHGLHCLVDAGCGARTTIAFTEMRHNFEDIPRLLEIAESLGVAAVVGLTLIEAGSARYSEITHLPAVEQYQALLDRYDHEAAFRARYDRLGRFAAIEWLHGVSGSAHTGCRFLQHPYVTADGLIFPCALLQADEFAGRGVYARPLAEIISDALPQWAELQRVSRERTAGMACLANCPGGRHCGGGCLARAYLPGRDLNAREDRCALRRAVYARQACSRSREGW